MGELCWKLVNPLFLETVAIGWPLILPAIYESRLYNIEKNPEIKGNGERTWNMRKKDKINIPSKPAKYKIWYPEESIQSYANLPA